MRTSLAVLALVTIALSPAAAQHPSGDHAPMAHAGDPRAGQDPLEHHLYAPELVMQHQSELGLQDAQRATIQAAMQQAQAKFLDTQWKLSAEGEKLTTLLHTDTVDETQALAQVDRILSLEREMKRAQISLMIRIKNTLTPAQQARLREIHHPDGEG